MGKVYGNNVVPGRREADQLVLGNGLFQGKHNAIRSQHQHLSLVIKLVGRPMDIASRQSVKLGLQLGIELVNVTNVNVISEATIPRRRALGAFLFPNAETDCLAMHISRVRVAKEHFETEDIGKEGQCSFNVIDDHEGRDLNKV
jgi:hypothetical protein